MMNRLFVFILRNDVWIYILCGLTLFWYSGQLIQALRNLRVAIFGLERERGVNQRNTSLIFISIALIIGGFVFFVNTQIAPNLPDSLLLPPTNTPDIFRTPLSSPTPLNSPVPSVTPPLVPTITLPQPGLNATPIPGTTVEIPTVTPTLGATQTPVIGCSLELNILDPRDGASVSNNIIFTGTAVTPNMSSYRLEINGPQTNGEWASLLGRDIPNTVTDSVLGDANLGAWEDGPYLVRLTALTAAGTPTHICVIQLSLTN
ncbi:MAG: hypothetical protein AAF490_20355 [Chloroflexota bacterium]